MQRLNLLDVDRQSLTTVLGGQEVFIRVWWQPTDASWYASVAMSGAAIVEGRRITLHEGLLDAVPTAFVGDLVCRHLGSGDGEPERHAWNRTHEVVYVP